MAGIDAMISQLEALGTLARDAAPDAARALRGALERQIAAGTDPQGKPWPKTREGDTPLQNAADALRVVNVDALVIAKLRGPEARHSKGTARGGIVRQVLPTQGIPPAYARAISGAVTKRFNAIKGA